MALKLAVEQCSITTRHPFAIARGSTNGYKRAWVRITGTDGQEGWGEADPSSFYGESLETVLAAFERLATHLPRDPFDLEAAEARWAQIVPKNWAARSALSAALHFRRLALNTADAECGRRQLVVFLVGCCRQVGRQSPQQRTIPCEHSG